MNYTLKLNEYIEKFSEIKDQLDRVCENVGLEQVIIENNGCSNKIVDQVVKYLKNYDLVVVVESSGVNALNRLYR